MKCEKCGNTIPDNSLMCPYCKKVVKREEEEKEVIEEVPNNYCSGCGQKLESNWVVCPRCGNHINEEEVDDDNAWLDSLIVIIWCVGLLLSYTVNSSFSILSLIIIIVGKAMRPKSKVINILFWITVIYVLLSILMTILLLAACASCIGSID